MRLNDGIIVDRSAIKNKYHSIKKFLKRLVNTRNLVADVIINNKIITTSLVTFSVDSGYIIACIDAKFALTSLVNFSDINIVVREPNSNDSLIESYTDGLMEGIPANDVDADLYFKVGSLFPYNNLKFSTPESHFCSMCSENIPKVKFEDLPSAVTTDDDEGGNNPDDGGNTGGDNPGGGNTGGGNTGGDNTGGEGSNENPGDSGNTGGDNTGSDNTGGNTENPGEGGTGDNGNESGDNEGDNEGGDAPAMKVYNYTDTVTGAGYTVTAPEGKTYRINLIPKCADSAEYSISIAGDDAFTDTDISNYIVTVGIDDDIRLRIDLSVLNGLTDQYGKKLSDILTMSGTIALEKGQGATIEVPPNP